MYNGVKLVITTKSSQFSTDLAISIKRKIWSVNHCLHYYYFFVTAPCFETETLNCEGRILLSDMAGSTILAVADVDSSAGQSCLDNEAVAGVNSGILPTINNRK